MEIPDVEILGIDKEKVKKIAKEAGILSARNRRMVIVELINAYASLREYEFDDFDGLIKIITEETIDKDDVIWRGEGGSADSIKVYYDGKWKKLDEFNGNEILGYEIIRKPDYFEGSAEEKAKRFYRIRRVEFEKKDGIWNPKENWVNQPTDVTKAVRETIMEVLDDFRDIHVALFGSGMNGTMGLYSNLNYTLISKKDDSDVDENFFNEFTKKIKSKGYNIIQGTHYIVIIGDEIEEPKIKYQYVIERDKGRIVELKTYLKYLMSH